MNGFTRLILFWQEQLGNTFVTVKSGVRAF